MIQSFILPNQLIERKKLSEEDNLFLKNLGSQLSAEEILNTLRAYKGQKLLNEKNAYLNRILEANKMILKEALTMGTALDILWEAAEETGRMAEIEKLLEKRVEERIEKRVEERVEKRIEKRIEKRVEKQAKLEMAKKMLLLGDPIERIAELTDLPLETIRNLN
ncbi:MAG: hypothetical protein FWG14_13995 [Peptococcaceae bacterium]|nr:hypothetical protein [Peptococcaceae bacterium]